MLARLNTSMYACKGVNMSYSSLKKTVFGNTENYK